MSWKSVEMQVALPRSQDAGKLQELHNKQNQHFQEALAQSQLIQEKDKRRKVQDFENVQLKNDSKRNDETNLLDEKVDKDVPKNMMETVIHPYLGNNFDCRS
ncbi:hypothetical protein [Ornithinibacillus halotolerans]|uniref:Uncharacterized protein n=1 Tax=Ornithinibacillus halotolerans TaxID=1274357 RepID=A0A916RN90_9BACI|nr:hypothetical protein [Ornithinibacillus halotolerans]GGA62803.1 hypothetical protein GCM10008025_03520 [Ornithinibacillus halotolerans]